VTTRQDTITAAIVRQVKKWNLTVREFTCKYEVRKQVEADGTRKEDGAYVYRIYAARRHSGLRGGRNTHVRYWQVDNLCQSHRDLINTLPKERM